MYQYELHAEQTSIVWLIHSTDNFSSQLPHKKGGSWNFFSLICIVCKLETYTMHSWFPYSQVTMHHLTPTLQMPHQKLIALEPRSAILDMVKFCNGSILKQLFEPIRAADNMAKFTMPRKAPTYDYGSVVTRELARTAWRCGTALLSLMHTSIT